MSGKLRDSRNAGHAVVCVRCDASSHVTQSSLMLCVCVCVCARDRHTKRGLTYVSFVRECAVRFATDNFHSGNLYKEEIV